MFLPLTAQTTFGVVYLVSKLAVCTTNVFDFAPFFVDPSPNLRSVVVTSGTVVNSTGTTVDYGFKINPKGGYMPIGLVYGPVTTNAMGSCADGAECWICTSGRCMAQTETGEDCTRGEWVGTSDADAGYVACLSEPASVQGHLQEVGHSITDDAARKVWVQTHFN